MKNTIALAILLACAGCSTSSIECLGIKAKNTRMFWVTTEFTAEFQTTNGVVKVSLKKSNTDADTMAAITDAAVSAALKKP